MEVNCMNKDIGKPTGGTFKLGNNDKWTDDIPYNASDADIDKAIENMLERMGMEPPDADKFSGWCRHCLPLPQVQCDDCQWDDDLMRPDEFIHQKVWKQDKN